MSTAVHAIYVTAAVNVYGRCLKSRFILGLVLVLYLLVLTFYLFIILLF